MLENLGIRPSIETFEEVPSIPENQTLLLNCLIKGKPKVTVEWFKNGNKTKPDAIETKSGGNDNTTTSLQINSVKLENSGNYTCKGSNQFGNVSKTFGVVVIGKW